MVNLVDVSDLKLTVGHLNGTLAKITHVGNLKLNNDVMLFDVLVIPKYTVSLLSVHKLIKDSHPTNQVLKLLKGSLNLSNIDHEGPCEVCHKAKQTRDSFPLSESKSNFFGQLMHLDVWDPYKVISREGFRYFLTIVNDYSRMFLSLKLQIIFFDYVESDPKPKASISLDDDEEGSSCRDGSVYQSGLSHSLDQPEVDEQIPTSGSGSDLQGFGNDGLITATPIDENTVLRAMLVSMIRLNKTLEPSSFEEASKDPNWISAMNHEMNALYENDTWFKARLVAKGFRQKEGLDYEETFSPVVKMGTVRCLLSLVVQNEWDIYQMDINNAFLYGDLIEEVYMLPPPGFFDPSDKRVCTSKVEIAKFKHFLSNRFKIKDLGELEYFWRIEVLKVSGDLCLSQRKYSLELLHDFGLLACRPVLTPLPENIILAHKETEKDKFLVNITSYQRLVGKLIYLTLTRPDISYVVHCLSQHMHAPLKSHFDIALRLLKYLKLASGFGVQFLKRQSGFDIKAFFDSDWTRCPITRRNLLPAELYCDNKAAMQIATNPVMHEKTKNFDLDVHFIREKVCSGLIKIVKVESKDYVADILTKALGLFQHDFLTKSLV
nr:ribonuclease H-like domain-containing protein [Tanacetum cinerariifolium]